MADPQIEQPLGNGTTDVPLTPASSPVGAPPTDTGSLASTPASALAPLETVMANKAGDKIGYDPTQKAWVDATTRKPYVAPPQELTEHPALPRQAITAADMVKNPKTGQTLAYDERSEERRGGKECRSRWSP